MSVYNITGWSGGGRRPLTYNLRAGQFRNMGGCNIFGTPTRTVINNNFGGYGYECDCGYNNGGGVPSWMQWMMGGGMVMNFLGQMMSAIFPGKESKGTEGKGGVADANVKADVAALGKAYKDNCTIQSLSDGTYIITGKDGKRTTAIDFDDLKAKLAELYDSSEPPKTESAKPVITEDMKAIAEALGITIETGEDGKPVYKVGDKSFANLPDAIAAAKNAASKPVPAAPAAAATANSVKLESGQQWYDIAVKYKPANMSIREAIGQLEEANGLKLTMAQRRTNDKGPAQFAKDGKIIIPDNWKTTES